MPWRKSELVNTIRKRAESCFLGISRLNGGESSNYNKKRLLKSMKIDKETDEKHGSGEGLMQLTGCYCLPFCLQSPEHLGQVIILSQPQSAEHVKVYQNLGEVEGSAGVCLWHCPGTPQ